MAKVARLLIYWLDAACRLVIPLRQVALAQLNKYHHQSGNAASGKLVWNQHKSQQAPLLGLDLWPFRVRGKPMNRWTMLPLDSGTRKDTWGKILLFLYLGHVWSAEQRSTHKQKVVSVFFFHGEFMPCYIQRVVLLGKALYLTCSSIPRSVNWELFMGEYYSLSASKFGSIGHCWCLVELIQFWWSDTV